VNLLASTEKIHRSFEITRVRCTNLGGADPFKNLPSITCHINTEVKKPGDQLKRSVVPKHLLKNSSGPHAISSTLVGI
jgi:hypothetical protein